MAATGALVFASSANGVVQQSSFAYKYDVCPQKPADIDAAFAKIAKDANLIRVGRNLLAYQSTAPSSSGVPAGVTTPAILLEFERIPSGRHVVLLLRFFQSPSIKAALTKATRTPIDRRLTDKMAVGIGQLEKMMQCR
ncbi:hypothetical protein [Sphingobium sp. BS19]|uniref:hypothetical protein n=1 Tax=Sphingobium sp. BS19 TaxID=3018973 RepID=UPI0022EE291E|nr:hypothetical protein [Sphingobium sp. BS19]GLJ00537.1 hypothetical protein Sbs19_43550 [Sphingobium sp. BS19]|tara:strand:- start:249 stop:662 length:414 start_codon:yes stop_codon:yes gene_type:complete